MTVRKYSTPQAFKEALEQRLRAASKNGVDFARRRQLLVFDRFLARIVAILRDTVLLKGGLVLELRLGSCIGMDGTRACWRVAGYPASHTFSYRVARPSLFPWCSTILDGPRNRQRSCAWLSISSNSPKTINPRPLEQVRAALLKAFQHPMRPDSTIEKRLGSA